MACSNYCGTIELLAIMFSITKVVVIEPSPPVGSLGYESRSDERADAERIERENRNYRLQVEKSMQSDQSLQTLQHQLVHHEPAIQSMHPSPDPQFVVGLSAVVLSTAAIGAMTEIAGAVATAIQEGFRKD